MYNRIDGVIKRYSVIVAAVAIVATAVSWTVAAVHVVKENRLAAGRAPQQRLKPGAIVLTGTALQLVRTRAHGRSCWLLVLSACASCNVFSTGQSAYFTRLGPNVFSCSVGPNPQVNESRIAGTTAELVLSPTDFDRVRLNELPALLEVDESGRLVSLVTKGDIAP